MSCEEREPLDISQEDVDRIMWPDPGYSTQLGSDMDLPGMWSHSDFEFGQSDAEELQRQNKEEFHAVMAMAHGKPRIHRAHVYRESDPVYWAVHHESGAVDYVEGTWLDALRVAGFGHISWVKVGDRWTLMRVFRFNGVAGKWVNVPLESVFSRGW